MLKDLYQRLNRQERSLTSWRRRNLA